ncbi:MAG TPA: hypothetical protein VK907_06635, partial [Phnomibacter sp.]|nr:hypothetical protein [Phnomibacter sp.]
DYTRFLFNELDAAAWQPDELELLEAEAKLLSNAEEIKSTLGQVVFALDESDPSLVQQLKQLADQLGRNADGLPELTELVDRLHSVHIEIQDVAQELVRVHEKVGLDPERLARVNERLSEGYRSLKKHHLSNTNELIALHRSLAEKLDGIGNIDEQVSLLWQKAETCRKEALALAKKVSAGRQKVLQPFEKTTTKYLGQMGMPNARLKAHCAPRDEKVGEEPVPGPHGIDEVALLFDANKTGRFDPLEKVASGGELSRLMLAIKAQVAKSIKLPALIFDEIDTGISGEAARQVGLLIRQLAVDHQVICITHQPQIAARADAHFFVYKQDKDGAIKTRLRRLEGEERVDAIAQMLSGDRLTGSARTIAREMVEAG